MGQEVSEITFTPEDFGAYQQRLQQETQSLQNLLTAGALDNEAWVAGFELEGWLLDHNFYPAPINQEFLQQVNDPLVVSELSRFNTELNGTPQPLQPHAFSKMQQELAATMHKCHTSANTLGASLMFIGTLPTLRNADLTMANMSPMKRYRALNDQVLKARQHKPIKLDISGGEHLSVTHHDVMLEAGTTSFQVHLQTPIDQFVRHFNASLILSAPIIAATANAPYLFGKDLWSETRIPLFEQAISAGISTGNARVNFGHGYIKTPLDCFVQDQTQHPVLLPILYDEHPHKFQHLRLYNGTIWRWNRPLVGFNDAGTPHIRIEHRIMPAGPSLVDMIANAALYLGACTLMASLTDAPEQQLAFDSARDNFYQAAKFGLDAELRWLNNSRYRAHDLLLNEIIPMAGAGLTALCINSDDHDYYLGILRARIESGQTGSEWQRNFIRRHGHHFHEMTAQYLHHQYSGKPVHEWEI